MIIGKSNENCSLECHHSSIPCCKENNRNKTAAILSNLKKSPIILPVPVASPLKTLPTFPAFNIPAPSLGDSLGPIQGFISGAQKAIQTAGMLSLSNISFLQKNCIGLNPLLFELHRFGYSILVLIDQ